ncbi:MAG: 4-hydroxy-tetrahydrodipicolinate synthase [Actinomycetia bacterium]|nr:4-hydroxy-tetrahydrodipicolinate synthase [Actinomycetes bacterium]
MSQQPRFGRLLTAMVTPFTPDYDLDLARAAQLAERLVAQGNEGLIINGTTGESPTISRPERLGLFRAVRGAVGGQVPLVANVGDNCTADSVDFASKVAKLGFEGLLVVTPYYNKPPQEGLYRHFRAVAEAVPDTPIVLYNIPGRCVINIEPETIVRLANDVPNILAVKQANSDMAQVDAILASAPRGFEVLSGDDDLTLEMMKHGGSGVISVTAHVAAGALMRMIDAYVAGDLHISEQINAILAPLHKALFMTSNPIMVKAALRMDGFDVGGLRLPLIEANNTQVATLREVLDSVRSKLRERNYR